MDGGVALPLKMFRVERMTERGTFQDHHTMAERDAASTFVMPETQLFRPQAVRGICFTKWVKSDKLVTIPMSQEWTKRWLLLTSASLS